MDESCSIVRKKPQLECALANIDNLERRLENSREETSNVAAIAATRTAQLRLLTARAMTEDMLRQPKSRGSHYCVE